MKEEFAKAKATSQIRINKTQIVATLGPASTSPEKLRELYVAGVDLLRSNRGPLVLEVNSSPGLKGIEMATGKDVASMIIQFIEKCKTNE